MLNKLLGAIMLTVISICPALNNELGVGRAQSERVTSMTIPLNEGGNWPFGSNGDFVSSIISHRALGGIKEGNIEVVTHWPATKSGYVHIWVTFENGDVLFLNDVNGRVAKLLHGEAAEWAKDWLVATKIMGRVISVAAVEGESPGLRRAYEFSIKVGERGEISLASPVTLAPKDKY